jgi:hypothetical protein
MDTTAREIIHSRDCYSATTEAPVLKLRTDRTDRELKAAQRQGGQDWVAGRHVHVNGCPEA